MLSLYIWLDRILCTTTIALGILSCGDNQTSISAVVLPFLGFLLSLVLCVYVHDKREELEQYEEQE